jgi:Pvc16 N-terminal domain
MLSEFLKIREEDILMDSPGELEPIPDTGLSLFLYKLSENPPLKNQDFVQDRYANPVRFRNPPLALDLFYLIIPFGNSESRQILLEKVMQLFHDFPILDKSLLSDDLVNSGNHELKILLNEITIDDLNKIWSLFPNKSYRLSISYMVTPLMIPSSRVTERAISRVITKETEHYLNEGKLKSER